MKAQMSEKAVTGTVLEHDRTLVQQIKSGNQEALEELIQKYGGKVYYLALQYTRNPQDAEEVLQDVFLKVYRKIDTFREAERLSPWLYKIAVNTALMKLRQQKRHSAGAVSLQEWSSTPNVEQGERTEVQLADLAPDSESILIRKEAQQAVRRAIAKLPTIYRTVVQLRDIEGFSLEEISEILSLSIPAVKSRLHRGRLIVQKYISRYMGRQPQKRPAVN